MTAKQHHPARAAPTEWQHIVPIVKSVPSRETRAAVPVARDSIATKMDVYAYNGQFVGRVKDVSDTELLVGRHWHADTRVPLDQVFAVMNARVILTRSAIPARR